MDRTGTNGLGASSHRALSGSVPSTRQASPSGPTTTWKRERGRWTVAAPEGFDAAVEPQAYVAAFGPEVGAWARLVPVQGPRSRFSVVVGPLGDAWGVLGTDPVTPR